MVEAAFSFPWAARRIAVLAAALLFTGCSSTRPWHNEPLGAAEEARYDGLAQVVDKSRHADLLVVASFSGGGSRAAAFAHAVLAELQAESFSRHGRSIYLSQEIDVVTGVSGGSVAAAHLALHGAAESIRRLPADFLEVDFQTELVTSVLSPANLFRATSPWFGRGHVLADALDRSLFQGATFGALNGLPGRPYLIVGATDLSTGADFDCTSEQLARLCSSIDHVPLSFAVAASSAVPLLFSPLTLQNHGPLCATQRQPAATREAAQSDGARVRMLKQESKAVGDPRRRHVHLVDGGMADNLGTRRITDYVAQAGGVGPVLRMLGLDQASRPDTPRRIVFIAVNSERELDLPMDHSDEVPSTMAVLDALVYAGLGRSSKETSLVFADAVQQWRQEIQSSPGLGSDADIHAIELKLGDVTDAQLRARVLGIPTAFRVAPQHLDALRMAARQALANSGEYQRFRRSVLPP